MKLIIRFRISVFFSKIKQTINNHEHYGLYVIYLWMSPDWLYDNFAMREKQVSSKHFRHFFNLLLYTKLSLPRVIFALLPLQFCPVLIRPKTVVFKYVRWYEILEFAQYQMCPLTTRAKETKINREQIFLCIHKTLLQCIVL